jgi:hypothetical protein
MAHVGVRITSLAGSSAAKDCVDEVDAAVTLLTAPTAAQRLLRGCVRAQVWLEMAAIRS